MALKKFVTHCFLYIYKGYNEIYFHYNSYFMSKTDKKCLVCSSNHIIKKGKRNGKQRFQCGDCQN
ncbi:IS1/IS1595 family N-terminal zinc-binding domain-containing protein [Capnocytophaga canimorsus]